MACWDGYKQVGMKKKGNKMVPNCVEESVIDKMAEDNTCVNCGNVVTERSTHPREFVIQRSLYL